jgi:hypothetical protein
MAVVERLIMLIFAREWEGETTLLVGDAGCDIRDLVIVARGEGCNVGCSRIVP